jgi:uncharacterized protein Yka (UPF0111/DUF47 family)
VPFQVIPRELAFFDLFDRAAGGVLRAVVDLAILLDDLPNAERHAQRIRDLEHEGDDLTHQIIALVNTTFVTPFDRKDMHRLASSLDDVIDCVEGLADLLVLLRIAKPLPQFVQQIEVLRRATTAVAQAVRELRSLHPLEAVLTEIKRAEREGDWVYRRGVAELYSGDYEPMQVLMWKDLLHQGETALDKCEDIANTVESVLLKFA